MATGHDDSRRRAPLPPGGMDTAAREFATAGVPRTTSIPTQFPNETTIDDRFARDYRDVGGTAVGMHISPLNVLNGTSNCNRPSPSTAPTLGPGASATRSMVSPSTAQLAHWRGRSMRMTCDVSESSMTASAVATIRASTTVLPLMISEGGLVAGIQSPELLSNAPPRVISERPDFSWPKSNATLARWEEPSATGNSAHSEPQMALKPFRHPVHPSSTVAGLSSQSRQAVWDIENNQLSLAPSHSAVAKLLPHISIPDWDPIVGWRTRVEMKQATQTALRIANQAPPDLAFPENSVRCFSIYPAR